MASPPTPQPLSFLEKVDLLAGQLSIVGSALWTVVTGVFRGNSYPKEYKLHVLHSIVRKLVSRLSGRQMQALTPSTSRGYEIFMKGQRLQPETVALQHGAAGHWIGNKDAKKVVIYYHGGGFVLSAVPAHFSFYNQLISSLNATGHDVSLFFVSYTLAPTAIYPTQLRQAISALRYILTETGRSPSDILLAGDSAGGNLALSTLLHLTHPNPAIEPLEVSGPLAGVAAFAPWVSFSMDGPSMRDNKFKDCIPPDIQQMWAPQYLRGLDGDGKEKERQGDAWSEPCRAPLEWWVGAKAEEILFLAGRDEVLFSAIDGFVERFKTVFPKTTYFIGYGESHVAPVYSSHVLGRETQQGGELQRWLGSRL
ncbi:putative 6-hexanolactone hydrolase [Aspergillus candidus]|uniref:Alpha/Beta hydrolase protein n=1 Tax=Aspergillus candidus TaxID=41067 RepID=A0A2I2F319_ASPCN|nr:Alpha/Beta hydrolase protein [Aspergillus candidus]PLB35031.1 Alpha/Beta hydrolase protein [Aspergillus candidus]